MIIVRYDIDYYAIPVSNLQHMEAIATYSWEANQTRGGLSPLGSLVDVDLSECISGGNPLLPGDLNVKHKDWNSRLNSTRGILLREIDPWNQRFSRISSCQ